MRETAHVSFSNVWPRIAAYLALTRDLVNPGAADALEVALADPKGADHLGDVQEGSARLVHERKEALQSDETCRVRTGA